MTFIDINRGVSSSLDSLTPERRSCNLKYVISKLISMADILNIACEIAHRRGPEDLGDDNSI